MALADIEILYDGGHTDLQARTHKVNTGPGSGIKAGELVLKALGSPYVTRWTVGVATKPVVATDYLAGYAMSTSTETSTATGTVSVMPILPGVVYLANPNVAATWNTQSEYDALVGDRVLLDSSATGVQTILASDGSTSGLVVEPLDVAKHPGKVAFSLRAGLSYLA